MAPTKFQFKQADDVICWTSRLMNTRHEVVVGPLWRSTAARRWHKTALFQSNLDMDESCAIGRVHYIEVWLGTHQFAELLEAVVPWVE